MCRCPFRTQSNYEPVFVGEFKMFLRNLAIVLLSSLSVLITSGLTLCAGDRFFSHRQRTRSIDTLSNYGYGRSTWPFTVESKFGTSAIAVAATESTDHAIKKKPFHLRATALTIDHLTLDEVGLTLYGSSGQLFASGRFTHSGGDGGLIGNNVTVRIHAYVAHPTTALRLESSLAEIENQITVTSPNDVNQIPPDAFRVCTCERKLWVSRGRPQHVSLVDPTRMTENQLKLRRHFDEITHIKLELEYQRDR